MNFAGTIARFGTGTYTVKRRAPSTVATDGRVDLGAETISSIAASVQPMQPGRVLDRNGEGFRVCERKRIYTTARLEPLDVVTIDAEDWQVDKLERWFDLGGFGKFIAIKVGN